MTYLSMFSAGISALNGNAAAFGAISDNIANSRTTGYKDSEVKFHEMVANRGQKSLFPLYGGIDAYAQNYIDHEGSIGATGRPLDLAIAGKGYFVTAPSLDNTTSIELTDAGTFSKYTNTNDSTGATYLVDGKGNYLLGWPYNATSGTFSTGTDLSTLTPIRVDSGANTASAIASTTGSIGLNLPSQAAVGDSYPFGFDIYDGTGSSDGIDDSHSLNFNWTKTGTNTWDMTITGTNGTVTSPAAAVPFTFDETGALVSPTSQSVTVNWTDSGATNTVAIDLSKITQYSGQFQPHSIATNGLPEGELQSMYFKTNGELIGHFTNGVERPLAKLPIGDVANPQKLQSVDGTHFKLSAETSDLTLYDADSTERAVFVPGSLEDSAVDLANEFTKMITVQRSYSSASKLITTADEMTQTAIRLRS